MQKNAENFIALKWIPLIVLSQVASAAISRIATGNPLGHMELAIPWHLHLTATMLTTVLG
jgi:hypothetical protein